MDVYRSLDAYQPGHNTVLTIGTFDGVHLGHRHILDQVMAKADEIGGESLLLSFHPHPRMVLSKDGAPDLRLLQTISEKIATLEAYGLDKLAVLPFTRAFSQLSAEDYVQQYLVEGLQVKAVVVGFDHRFGADRTGDFDLLTQLGKRYGFSVHEIDAHLLDDAKISSTRIRKALREEGAVREAAELLGRPYTLTGTVMHGDHLGRTIGFPTANLGELDAHKLIPANGVFAVRVSGGGAHALDGHPAMLNIGYRPTVDGQDRRIEAHLLDFDGDLYGQELTIAFIQRLRDEQAFDGLDALKAQLALDKVAAAQVLDC